MAQVMNRALRRKIGSEVLKLRDQSKAKKQWGFGLVFTNQIGTLTFWRWVVVFYDRRMT